MEKRRRNIPAHVEVLAQLQGVFNPDDIGAALPVLLDEDVPGMATELWYSAFDSEEEGGSEKLADKPHSTGTTGKSWYSAFDLDAEDDGENSQDEWF